MSIEQPIDPEAVEATRAQLRRAIEAVGQLAASDVQLQTFFDKFISQIVTAMVAAGGAVWLMGDDDKTLKLDSPVCLPGEFPRDAQGQQSHGQLLATVFSSGEPTVARPGPWSGEADEGGNPTPYLLLLAPLATARRRYGLVEVYQRPDADAQAQRGYLKLLVQVTALACDFLKSREIKELTDREGLWNQLDRFGQAVHRSLDVTQTAYTLANEACGLIGCDRVSVVVRRRRRSVIEAVSGQDVIEKRANAVRLLQALARQVIKSGQEFWYSGNTADIPPQLEDPLQAYIDESHTRCLGIVPLSRDLETDTDLEEVHPRSEVIGALVVERIDQEGPVEATRQKAALVARRGTAALANAIDHDRVFLMPVWKRLEKIRWFVEARRLPKTLAVLAFALVMLVGLCVIPADFQITAQGTLQPAVRRDVFVQEAGVVNDVLVDEGQHVKAGDPLVELRSRDLEVQIAELQGRWASTHELMLSTRWFEGDSRLDPNERSRLSGQYAQLQKTYDSLAAQLQLLTAKKELLTVHSPIDGIVVTWDVKRQLAGRSVDKGQVLMSVADTRREWELELLLPEAQSGHVARVWEALPPQQRTMPVHFILATDPARRFDGQLVEIQQRAEVRGDDGNTVMVRVKIDANQLARSDLRPGAAVTGRIDCGRRSIGYVWFHDVLAFIRSKILFRL